MRYLGFLFVIVLLLAVVGLFRGWFSASTAQAGGKSQVTLGVDKDKIDDDAQKLAAKVGELSAKAAETVRSLGRKVGPEESELSGALTSVDLAGRDLSVTAGAQTIDLHVPSAVPITRDGESVGFEQLHMGTRVKLSFKHGGDARILSRVEILR